MSKLPALITVTTLLSLLLTACFLSSTPISASETKLFTLKKPGVTQIETEKQTPSVLEHLQDFGRDFLAGFSSVDNTIEQAFTRPTRHPGEAKTSIGSRKLDPASTSRTNDLKRDSIASLQNDRNGVHEDKKVLAVTTARQSNPLGGIIDVLRNFLNSLLSPIQEIQVNLANSQKQLIKQQVVNEPYDDTKINNRVSSLETKVSDLSGTSDEFADLEDTVTIVALRTLSLENLINATEKQYTKLTVSSSLDVTGTSNFSTTNITGVLKVGSNINSDSSITLDAGSFVRIGDSSAPGHATGDTDLYVQGKLEVDSSVDFGTSLNVTGDTSLGSKLTAANTSVTHTFGGITITGSNIVIPGTTKIGGNTYTWPTTVTNGYALTTDGSGTLSWSQAGVNDASYLVLGANSSLTAERVLTAGSNISLSDAGAGGALTISVTGNLSQWTTNGASIYYNLGTGTSYVGIGNSNPLQLLTVGTGASASAITNAGYLGVGTTSPSELLHVYGANQDILLENISSLTYGIYLKNAGANTGWITSNPGTGEIQYGASSGGYFPTFYSNNLERMRIDSSGDVGIGNTNPLQLLQVGTGASTSVITNAGFLGVGTSSPTSKLSVYTTTNADGININGTTNPALSISNSGTVKAYIGLATSANQWVTGSSANDLVIRTEDGTGGNIHFAPQSGNSSALTILRSGNVGIATTNPLQLFQTGVGTSAIVHTSSGNIGLGTTSPDIGQFGITRKVLTISAGTSGDVLPYIELQGSRTGNNNYGSIEFYHQTNRGVSLEGIRDGADNSAAFAILTMNSGTLSEKFRIASGGNVGIGLTGSTPVQLLHVGIGASATVHTSYGFVGIGTTSPVYALDVRTNGQAVAGQLQSNGANQNPALQFNNSSGTNLGGVGGIQTVNQMVTEGAANDVFLRALVGALHFATGSNANTRMVITNTGLVGIGTSTSTPTQLLQVGVGVSASVITNSGRLGIGTTSPATALEVSANDTAITFTDTSTSTKTYISNVNGDFQIVVNRNPITGVFSNTSAASSVINLTGTNGDSSIAFYTASVNNTTATERVRIEAAGDVGVGSTNPNALFTVGSANQFQVNSSGAITASTGYTQSSGTFSFTSATATGNSFSLTNNALSTGTLQALTSTSTSLSTGGMLSIDWSPTTSTTSTGDLVSINIGVSGNVGNLFNIKDSGSSVFAVSETAVTTSLPTNFTAPGDVALSYDLNFTNPTSSFVKSSAPLYIQAGETFGSSDLVLKTFNSGDVVFDAAGGASLVQSQAWELATATASLYFVNGSGTQILNLDATNARVGIGVTAPTQLLQVGVGNSATVITNTGFVGIGRTSPISALHVHGEITMSSAGTPLIQDTSGNNMIDFLGASGVRVRAGSTGPMMTWYSDSEKMRIDYLGRLGIGTTTPTQLLQVGLGASASVITNAGLLGVGTTSPLYQAHVRRDQNGSTAVVAQNATAGTGAFSLFHALDDTAGTGLYSLSSSYSSAGLFTANYGVLATDTAKAGLAIGTVGAGDPLIFGTANVERMRIDGSGGVFINDSSNASSTIGLTINQGANDDEVLALKSSDVAHGMTTNAETDTFFNITKNGATQGGVLMHSFRSSGTSSFIIRGVGDTDDTTKSTGAVGYIVLDAAKKTGTTYGAAGANANLLVIRDATNGSRFIFDEEGTGHADDVWTDNAFDLAEDYPVQAGATLETGDVVSHVESIGVVNKSAMGYQKELFGVVSYHTAQLSAFETDTVADHKPIALIGRVPVKVNLENGEIHRGDYLTSSSVPGVAMKATKPGMVLGRALEDYTAPGISSNACSDAWRKDYDTTPVSTNPCEKIVAYVNVGFADPTDVLSDLVIGNAGDPTRVRIDKNGSVALRKLTVSDQVDGSSDPSIGSATMTLGTASVTINSNQITSTAKVFVTPRTKTNGAVLAVESIIPGTSFTVSTDAPVTSDVTFDWWIVETR